MPKEEIQRLTENIAPSKEEVQSSGGWHHLKKDGTVIDVEINSYAAIFGGRKARVVLAQDPAGTSADHL